MTKDLNIKKFGNFYATKLSMVRKTIRIEIL